MKTIGFGFALWMAAIGVVAQTTMRFEFPAGDVKTSEAAGYLLLSLKDGLTPDLTPGLPAVPARYVNILLPAGAEFVSLDVQAEGALYAENVTLYPAQPPRRPGTPPPAFVGPDAAAYASSELTPAAWAECVGVQEMRGRRFATVRLNPLRYQPAARQIWLAPEIEVTVNQRMTRRATPAMPMSPLFGEMLNRSVVNPEPARRAGLPAANRIPYIIVTRAALAGAFEALAAHREALFPGGTAVVTVEEILSAFPGRDDAEKVRNFIIQAVQTNQTDFIALGGDDTIVPARMCGIKAEKYTDITPADLYYSGLDGDWDANHNDIFGELADNVDMAPDVIVSRIPVRAAQDVARYLAKLVAYESGSRADLHGKLFLSGTEAWNLIYGSARGTDTLFDSYAQFQEHQPVSDAEHWARRIHRDTIQPHWSASTLDIFFDTLTTWDEKVAGDFKQTPERFVDVYNQGWEHQYYETHGNWNLYALAHGGRFRNEQAASLTNLTCFITTVACLTSFFDGTNDPCLAETFLRGAAGALVYHGCSRFGWGDWYPTHYYGGPSPDYAMQYLERLFDGSAASFGQAYALGKAHFIGASTNNGAYRWLQFGINLLGDPAVPPRANSIPAAPTLASAVNTNLPSPGIFIEWRDHSTDATGFDVQRSGGTDGVWRVIASAGGASYFDAGVASNAFYLYRVRATNAAGHSIWSGAGGLFVGALAPDAWDPADDASAGATGLADFPAAFTNHGPHTLSAADTNDWFRFDVVRGMVYQFTTLSSDNFGGLYARVYDGQTNLVAADGDTNGLNHFAFYLAPTNSETWRMRIEPNGDRDSASYRLYYRAEEDRSSSAALGAALDATQLVWRASANLVNPWFAQTNEYRFGGSAAQSGQIYRPDDTTTPQAAYSWIETGFEAASPAFLSFWLKTELDPGAQLVYDSLGGTVTISESADWAEKQMALFNIAAPTVVTMRFELASADSGDPIDSRVWLDQFHLIRSNDMVKLPLGLSESNTLASGYGRVYEVEAPSAGFVALDLDSDGSADASVYDENGFPLTVETTGTGIRWMCAGSGTYYLLLENNMPEPMAYRMAAGFHLYRYVSVVSATPVAPFTSWATAARTIQDAVDAAIEGDIVLVTNGVYAAGGRTAGAAYAHANRVCVTNAITVRSVGGAAKTIIAGAKDPATGGPGSNAVRCAWLAEGALLEGFTLTNGASSAGNGLERCGGGAWCQGAGARLERCVIGGNAAILGGGTYQGSLTNCAISGNRGESRGGGAEGGTLSSCALTGNATAGIGGGADDAILYNCLVAGNEAGEFAGGSFGGSLFNCTAVGNSAPRCGGVALSIYGMSRMDNSIVYYNRADYGPANLDLEQVTNVSYLCAWPAPSAGSGHITNAPLIASLFNARLLPGSPCFNAGTNQPWMAGAADLLERTRIMYDTVDIGACEFEEDIQMGALEVSATSDYSHVAIGYPVEFAAEIQGECLGYVWNFGDGHTATNLALCEHAYALPGRYDAVLRASNLSMTLSATVTIRVAKQSIAYVSLAGAHVSPFASWANAATTIQAAVDAVCAGGVALVANGVYSTGGRAAGGAHTLANRVCVAKPMSVRSVNGPERTVIVGAKGAAGSNGLDAVRCVWLANGASLAGFTLTDGATSGSYSDPNGGGGGAWCQSSRASISNCIIAGNSAISGGGTCGGTLRQCVLRGNTAASGGGAHMSDLYNCLVNGNRASSRGGGAAGYVRGDFSTYIGVFNCAIVGNFAPESGGVYYGEIRNSIVFGNQAVSNSANYDVDSVLSHSCSEPLFTNGAGNIAADPRFAGAGDYRLQSNSPCVNAGTNEDWMAGAKDFAGNSRIVGPRADMGAYEYPLAPSGLSAAAAAGGVRVAWNAVGGDLGIRVYRSGIEVASLPAGATSWTDASVYCGQAFYYSIEAFYGADWSVYSAQAAGRLRATGLDFDGDSLADAAVYSPFDGRWYILRSSDRQMFSVVWGWAAAWPVAADYDGDCRADMAVYWPAEARWYVLRSSDWTPWLLQWGWNETVPVPADYDGDGMTDVAVYWPGGGRWYARLSSSGQLWESQWGWADALPAPADYDGDGRADLAVYWPAGGQWHIWLSGSARAWSAQWGWADARPVAADYDGDGKADLAVYWPGGGQWHILKSSNFQPWMVSWGWSAAQPAPMEYHRAGVWDTGVYWPAGGNWYLLDAGTGANEAFNWGWSAAMPVAPSYQILRWYGLLP